MHSDCAVLCLTTWYPLLCFLLNPWWPVLMYQLWLQSYECLKIEEGAVQWEMASFYSAIKHTPCPSLLCIFKCWTWFIRWSDGNQELELDIVWFLWSVQAAVSNKQVHWVLWIRPNFPKSGTWADVVKRDPDEPALWKQTTQLYQLIQYNEQIL